MRDTGRRPDPPKPFLKEGFWNPKNFCKKGFGNFGVVFTNIRERLPEDIRNAVR